MIAIAVASLLLLALITGIVGLVVVGLEGRGSDRLARLRTQLAKAARHLNGDGEPAAHVPAAAAQAAPERRLTPPGGARPQRRPAAAPPLG